MGIAACRAEREERGCLVLGGRWVATVMRFHWCACCERRDAREEWCGRVVTVVSTAAARGASLCRVVGEVATWDRPQIEV